MKTLFKLLVVMCVVASSSATFNLLKSKLSRISSLVQPQESYRTVRYLVAPAPLAYSRPVSTFSAHLSTYRTSLPSVAPVATYGVPVASYNVPVAHVSTYGAPVAVYGAPAATLYGGSSLAGYHLPATAYVRTLPDLDDHIIEEHYSNYGENYAKHYRHYK